MFLQSIYNSACRTYDFVLFIELRPKWLSCSYLRAPEKRQDTKSPGIPGMCPRTSNTKSGSNYGNER